ncbi:efflux RND transporter periplasmic adaptor subunit [Aridibaculum aurantiacum]|uniref:efflux RND transporter periplasmic adaptor subunit n=1 Tax=Aridibaculum aurantiacum TaxID=2810307 RepID=UPI001A9790E6|nr:efflux RND transporter periplasmic adaptor subunit [Aridibaculum aurantiacum]
MKKFITIVVLLLYMFGFDACKEHQQHTEETTTTQTYTCPMHPQIVQTSPGTCPICAMDLVPFDKNNVEENLMLGNAQRMLANVVTDTVRTGTFSSTKQLNGRLVINPEQIEIISSRVAGRLETLLVKETGVSIRKGQPLYRIYSEQLAAMQQEYLVAIAQAEQFPGDAKFQQIADAAKQRLLLFDQTGEQVRQLRTSRKPSPYITYYATAGGVVAELFTAEGQYVAEGSPIVRVEGFQDLWVEADLYTTEASSVREGQLVTVTIAGYDVQHKMRVDFIAPSLQAGSQLLTIRGKIPNPGNRYTAGMQVFVDVPISNVSDAVTVPVNALIRDGNGTHLWIETEPNIFEARSVTTGAENFNRVEIKSGLSEGEAVVISGAYLLYSEFVLKKGKTPAGQHNH